MKGAEASAGDNGYDPTRYIRGDVLGVGDKDSGHDGAGLRSKHETHACRLEIRGQEKLADGPHAIPYSSFIGQPWMKPDQTEVRFTFAGELYSGQGDEWTEGKWQVIIPGKNLEPLFFDLAEAKRVSIHQSKKAEGREVQVDPIRLKELE